jgi:hypothetical protein
MEASRIRRRAAVAVVALFYTGATYGLVAQRDPAPNPTVVKRTTVTRTITVPSPCSAGDKPFRDRAIPRGCP